jgi:hypothetical protein
VLADPDQVAPADRGLDAHSPGGPCAPFMHPGTLMGPQEISLLRHRILYGEQPWTAALEALRNSTPRGYT